MTKEQIEALGITYVDGMTDDEVVAKITESKKVSDAKIADLTGRVDNHKKLIDKYTHELSEAKKEKEAKLTDEEKTNLRIQELESNLSKANRTIAKSERVATYVGIGYSKELAEKIADAELDGKDATKYHQEFIKSHDEALKQEIMKNNPAPKGGGGNGGNDTIEEKWKAGTLSMNEMNELKESNPELYNHLVNEVK